MGGEWEWEDVMRQAQDDLEAANNERWRREMEQGEKRDRHAKAREEAYRAGFADGVGVGKEQAETMRALEQRVEADHEKVIVAGLAKLAGHEKPRRTRRKRTATELVDPALPSTEI